VTIRRSMAGVYEQHKGLSN